MQPLQALVVAREQQRLDAEQVAVLAGHAMVERQFDAQIGEVMAFRALLGPETVAAQGGDHYQRQGACQEFSHQAVQRLGNRGFPRVVPLRGRINKLSVSIIEPVQTAV